MLKNVLKKIITTTLAAVLVAVMLAGCTDNNGSLMQSAEVKTDAFKEGISEEITFDEENVADDFFKEHMSIDDLPEEDLKKPDRVIKSLDDYIYLLDYLAFYRIGEKIFFEIDDAFAEEIYNPYKIHQKAYTMADLADVYACQMDDSFYSEHGVVGIKYSMSRDIASEPPLNIGDTKVIPSFDYGSLKTEGENKSNGETIHYSGDQVSCENSEQLYYLVMNGYTPVPEKGSIAEMLLQEAEAVINKNISDDMSDLMKIKAIYDWLTTEVRYDKETAYSKETYLVKEQAYYLEGVFLNRYAVCDGKAKAYALLLNMAGVPCLRTTGVNDGGDHAWNMVCLDGKWYISCSTYGQADMTDTLGRIVPDYSIMLSGKETPYDWYPAQKHTDIEDMLEEDDFDIYEAMGKMDGIELKAENVSDVENIIYSAEEIASDSAKVAEEFKVEFLYTGNDKETFEDEMINFLEGKKGINAREVRCEYGVAYQLIKYKAE